MPKQDAKPDKMEAAGPKLIEIHILQNHVPANMNRDDLGAPKTAMFGGTLRARISSQCLKRSVRNPGRPSITSELSSPFVGGSVFAEEMRKVDRMGVRTKLLPTLVTEEFEKSRFPNDKHTVKVKKKDVEKTEQELIVGSLVKIAKAAKAGKEEEEEGESQEDEQESSEEESEIDADAATKQLIFLGHGEEKRLVAALRKLRDSMKDDYLRFLVGKAPSDAKKKKPSNEFYKELQNCYLVHPVSDVALFGRMTTSPAFADVDAAMSVAHAISTHEVVPQTDYWTGVDDIVSTQKDGGAGHVSEALFNSATFYKYASLDWQQLLKNLSDNHKLAIQTIGCFLHAFVKETPSGNRHSHAHNNPFSAILIEIRDKNIPTNYANAFVKPVDHKNGDLPFNSAQKLKFYVEQVQETYAGKPCKRFWLWMPSEEGQEIEIRDSQKFEPIDNETRLDALVRTVAAYVGGEK